MERGGYIALRDKNERVALLTGPSSFRVIPLSSYDAFYDRADLYDLAFAYRDFAAEADVLTAWFREMTGRASPGSVLELAAGPARHAREFARRGAEAWALDLSQPMNDYARRQAEAEGVRLKTVTANMTMFELPHQFDLALLLLDSVSHLLKEQELVDHLRSVGRTLRPGGVYVIEAAHPADDLPRVEDMPTREWTVQQGSRSITVRMGGLPGDTLDARRRIRVNTLQMDAKVDGRPVSFTEHVTQRAWKREQFDEALREAGGFGDVRRYGDWAPDADFELPGAWRMIYVMQRQGGARRAG